MIAPINRGIFAAHAVMDLVDDYKANHGGKHPTELYLPEDLKEDIIENDSSFWVELNILFHIYMNDNGKFEAK